MIAKQLLNQLAAIPQNAELTNGFLYEHGLRSAIDKAGFEGLENIEYELSQRLAEYLKAPAGLYIDNANATPVYVVSV